MLPVGDVTLVSAFDFLGITSWIKIYLLYKHFTYNFQKGDSCSFMCSDHYSLLIQHIIRNGDLLHSHQSAVYFVFWLLTKKYYKSICYARLFLKLGKRFRTFFS